MTPSNSELLKLRQELTKYFLERKIGDDKFNILFSTELNKIAYPLVFNRNFLSHEYGGNGNKTNKIHSKWMSNPPKYDKYVLEHILPIIKKHCSSINQITLTFSCEPDRKTFPSGALHITYKI